MSYILHTSIFIQSRERKIYKERNKILCWIWVDGIRFDRQWVDLLRTRKRASPHGYFSSKQFNRDLNFVRWSRILDFFKRLHGNSWSRKDKRLQLTNLLEVRLLLQHITRVQHVHRKLLPRDVEDDDFLSLIELNWSQWSTLFVTFQSARKKTRKEEEQHSLLLRHSLDSQFFYFQ